MEKYWCFINIILNPLLSRNATNMRVATSWTVSKKEGPLLQRDVFCSAKLERYLTNGQESKEGITTMKKV